MEQRPLDIAAEAGHILLENGAEIARVEETMQRICSHYGENSADFFVLGNGIFTTSSTGFAKTEFIPFKGAQLERVAAVNQLSRDICYSDMTTAEAASQLRSIRKMPGKGKLIQTFGSAIGSAGFCIIFGGSFLDSAAAFIVGAILWTYVLFVGSPYLSKMACNIVGSAIATILCILLDMGGLCSNLSNVMIGSLIPLIPGIPFTNGIKDIGNEDYIAGTTRLLDALLVFLSIAIGVVAVFSMWEMVSGSMIVLHGNVPDSITARIPIQIVAAFVGTVGFSILFGVPSGRIVAASVCAAFGWLTYLLIMRYTPMGLAVSTVAATAVAVILSRLAAPLLQTPSTVFQIPGIFPMVPGGGLFWTSYYIASNQLQDACSAGFTAVKVTVAIVIGIIFIDAIPPRYFAFAKIGKTRH